MRPRDIIENEMSGRVINRSMDEPQRLRWKLMMELLLDIREINFNLLFPSVSPGSDKKEDN